MRRSRRGRRVHLARLAMVGERLGRCAARAQCSEHRERGEKPYRRRAVDYVRLMMAFFPPHLLLKLRPLDAQTAKRGKRGD